jgi:hypothetical protein
VGRIGLGRQRLGRIGLGQHRLGLGDIATTDGREAVRHRVIGAEPPRGVSCSSRSDHHDLTQLTYYRSFRRTSISTLSSLPISPTPRTA